MPTATDPEDAAAYEEAVARLCDHYRMDVASASADLDESGIRIHYLTAGTGPPLLLLHGLSSTAAVWIPALDALTDRFTVFVPDRPGRGLSTPVDYGDVDPRTFLVDTVSAFLDSVGIDRANVVGNSMGGFQALALAIDRPERVRRLGALGAPAGLSRTLPPAPRLLAVPGLRRLLFRRLQADSVSAARAASRGTSVIDDSALPDEYFEPRVLGDRLPGRRDSLRSLVESFITLRGVSTAFDLRADLEELPVPTTLVWGTEDPYWPPSVGRQAVAAMPNAELVVLDEHGHMPWLEPGEAATEAVINALDRDR